MVEPTLDEIIGYMQKHIDSQSAAVLSVREQRTLLARLSAPVQLQAHQNAFWNKHGMPSMLPSSCFKCGHVGEPSTTHAELPNVYICKACVAAPVPAREWIAGQEYAREQCALVMDTAAIYAFKRGDVEMGRQFASSATAMRDVKLAPLPPPPAADK